MDFIKHTCELNDKFLIVTPEGGFKDNSVYEIKFLNIKSDTGDAITKTIKFTTKLKPLYCGLFAVKSLFGEHKIEDEIILFQIREASKFADYIQGKETDEDNVPFNVSQFVKYYAARECLLRHSIDISAVIGATGKVGDVSFGEKETAVRDMSKLIKIFSDEIEKWKDDLKGYPLEGRAKMQTTIRGSKASPIYQTLDLKYERTK